MKLVSISQNLIDAFQQDKEMLKKTGRPCVLVVRLKYRGTNYNFAVPLRSNISANTPKRQYFPLPTRSTTKSRNRHGIHYIKMFPVEKRFLIRYRTEGNQFAELIKRTVDNNEKQIVRECQRYLDEYEAGNRTDFSTDIDLLLKILQGMGQ